MNLFLDDIRTPLEAFEYTAFLPLKLNDWHVVKSHNDFVAFIECNGIPALISFDHDLAPSHYTPEHLWTDYDLSKQWQDRQVHTEKTGYECALWLVEYCRKNGCKLPGYFCHSMNPVGKGKILNVLDSYKMG